MQEYGIIKDGELQTSHKQLEGYKPVEYAKIPEDFDQETHFITQKEPVDKDKNIYVGVDIHDLDIEDDDDDELF